MSGSSRSVVSDQAPWASFSMRDSFPPSQRTCTLVAAGSLRRKVTRPSAWTSGETSCCEIACGTTATRAKRSGAPERARPGAFIMLILIEWVAQGDGALKRKCSLRARRFESGPLEVEGENVLRALLHQ